MATFDDHGFAPTGQLPPAAWITAPETVAVLAALTAGGAQVRFVGGCVRDGLLKRPVKDVDLATPDAPERVIELLERAGLKAVPTGIAHGTVTAVCGGKPFEVTTLRLDLQTDGRRAKVAYTNDWLADAARRDFTINAFSATPDGAVWDPFGGLHDLAHGIIRFVGVPRDRIREDRLRILRFFRFFASHGRPPADADALAACREQAPELVHLSAERVRGELLRILLAPNPAETIGLMRGQRVLEHILPHTRDVGPLRLLAWLEEAAVRIAGVAPDALRRLAALVAGGPAELALTADKLKLSNKQKERLRRMGAAGPALDPETGAAPEREAAQRRLIYGIGAEAARDRALLAWAGELAIDPRQPRARKDAWMALLERIAAWQPPILPIGGGDVKKRGVAAGPRVGGLLRELEAWWIDGDFAAPRAACLRQLNRLIAVEGNEK